MKHMEICMVHDVKALNEDVFSLTLHTEHIAKLAEPGQFVNVYPNEGDTILPRPISICDVADNKITLLIAVVGKGTSNMKALKKGDTIRILGPLGNGFTFDLQNRKHVLVGGGIGIAPLYFLSKQLKGDIKAFLGYRERSFYKDMFEGTCRQVFVSSDLGMEGIKGNVLDAIKLYEVDDFDMMYICGPKIMMKAVAEHFASKADKIQVSLEERMACGISVCLACVCKKNDGTKIKVCGDGPVFMSKDVVL